MLRVPYGDVRVSAPEANRSGLGVSTWTFQLGDIVSPMSVRRASEPDLRVFYRCAKHKKTGSRGEISG
jgi:hypothetical protein